MLHLLGLPVGADMDGRVWSEMLESPGDVERIPSWETVPGDDGRARAAADVPPPDAAAAIEQLAALGYVARPTADAARDAAAANRDARTNLALSLMDAQLPVLAIPLLKELRAADESALHVGGSLLATCYFRVGRRAEARRVAEALIARSRDDAAPAHGRPRERPEIAAQPRTRGTDGPRLIPQPDLLLGMLDLEEGALDSALEHLRRAEEAQRGSADVRAQLGRLYLRMRRYEEATHAFSVALEADADDHRAHDGLAEVCLALHRDAEAAEHALAAVGRHLHDYAPGHYHLGVALARLGMYARAMVAFEEPCRSMRADLGLRMRRGGSPGSSAWSRASDPRRRWTRASRAGDGARDRRPAPSPRDRGRPGKNPAIRRATERESATTSAYSTASSRISGRAAACCSAAASWAENTRASAASPRAGARPCRSSMRRCEASTSSIRRRATITSYSNPAGRWARSR